MKHMKQPKDICSLHRLDPYILACPERTAAVIRHRSKLLARARVQAVDLLDTFDAALERDQKRLDACLAEIESRRVATTSACSTEYHPHSRK